MNLYLVKVSLNGILRDIWIKCDSEETAVDRASAQMYWGGRIEQVKFVRRCA